MTLAPEPRPLDPVQSHIHLRYEALKTKFLDETRRAALSPYDELHLRDWARATEFPLEVITLGIERAVDHASFRGVEVTCVEDCQMFIRQGVAAYQRRMGESASGPQGENP